MAITEYPATGSGTGDMTKAIYDPNGKNTDAFDADNHVLDTASFDNNLDGTITNTQALADAVDELTTGGSGDMLAATYDPNTVEADAFDADYSNINIISGADYTSVQDFINQTQGVGKISGFAITDGGSGTIDVAAGNGLIKTSDSNNGNIVAFKYAGGTALDVLTDNNTNWIYIDYNSGSPTVAATTDIDTISLTDQIIIGRVYRTGTTLTIFSQGQNLSNFEAKECERLFRVFGSKRASGLILGEAGTRNITVTSGILYCGHNKVTEDAIDTSGADTFSVWNSSDSTTADSTGVSQYDNTQYWDGSALATLNNNYYGTRFFYLDFAGNLHMQYGVTNAAALSTANDTAVPTPPDYLRDFAVYLGRIVIEKNGSSASTITTAFESTESGQTVENHNDLANIKLAASSITYGHITDAAQTIAGSKTFVDGIKSDTVAEETAAAGVTVDSLKIKDAGFELGSDAEGDIYYRNSSGALTRLAVGTNGQCLQSNGTIPTWADAVNGVSTTGTPAANDFARFTDADTIEGRSYSEALSDLSGQAGADFSFNSNKITNVTDPTSAQDAATKAYVDANAGSAIWQTWTGASRTDDSTITSTTNLEPGTAVRFKATAGNYEYAVIGSRSTNAHTIIGHPITTADDDVIEYDSSGNKVVSETIQLPGNFNDADDDTLLSSDLLMKEGFRPAISAEYYLVGMYAICDSADTSSDPDLNAVIFGGTNKIFDTDLNVDETVSDTATTVDDTNRYYALDFTSKLDLSVDKVGAGDAYDATVTLIFVKA